MRGDKPNRGPSGANPLRAPAIEWAQVNLSLMANLKRQPRGHVAVAGSCRPMDRQLGKRRLFGFAPPASSGQPAG